MGSKRRTAKHPRALRAADKPASFAEQTSAVDDPTGPMGIRLITRPEGSSVEVVARTPTLVLPVHAGLVGVTVGAVTHVVDRAGWLLVPKGARARLDAKSPVTHTVLLDVKDELRAAVARAYDGEIDEARYDRYLRDVQLLPRTVWVNELVHRYLFERAVCKKKDNVATKFLEMEIVKELYFVSHEQHSKSERASVVRSESPLVQRAMALVEEHLFDADVAARLAKRVGASASTLLRTFKREVGVGPRTYIQRRRLDESLMLLKSRRFAVGEVASMVGYRNFAAFSQAFRARFGMRPSEVT